MTEKQYQEAAAIRHEINTLKQHRKEVRKQEIALSDNETVLQIKTGGCGSISLSLYSELTGGMIESYLEKLSAKIDHLEKQFSKL